MLENIDWKVVVITYYVCYTIVMIYVGFIVLAALVVFLSLKLSKYVDLLDKTTNVSGAFIGGILLAAVTSLPELFTSLSATLFLKQNSLVLGNILGSNLFNLGVLAVAAIVMFAGFKKAKIGKNHILTVVGFLVIYGLIAMAMFWVDMPKLGYVNIISPIILLIYVFVVIKTPKTEESTDKFECALSTKQIILRFILAAVLLIGASVCITFLTDTIATNLNLGKTFAGALLLGMTTSLPELVSTFSLCKRGNFNAATGNIFGSNIFNFAILVLADVLSFGSGIDSVYTPFNMGAAGLQSMLLLFLGIIASVLMLAAFIAKCYAKPTQKLLVPVTTVSASSLTVICYLLFIILSVVL